MHAREKADVAALGKQCRRLRRVHQHRRIHRPRIELRIVESKDAAKFAREHAALHVEERLATVAGFLPKSHIRAPAAKAMRGTSK